MLGNGPVEVVPTEAPDTDAEEEATSKKAAKAAVTEEELCAKTLTNVAPRAAGTF